MESLIDRRAALPAASLACSQADTSKIVRRGILLRARLGTVGAVEFLKTHGTDSAVITRVLTGEHMRDEDSAALAQHEADLILERQASAP